MSLTQPESSIRRRAALDPQHGRRRPACVNSVHRDGPWLMKYIPDLNVSEFKDKKKCSSEEGPSGHTDVKNLALVDQ